MIRLIARLRRADSGAVAIEFAVVAMAAIAIFLGMIEFGRALYMRNEMSYAADHAARKILTDPTVTDDEVEKSLRDAITFGSSENLKISFAIESVEMDSFRTLQVNYPLTLLIPNLTNNTFMLTIARRVPLG